MNRARSVGSFTAALAACFLASCRGPGPQPAPVASPQCPPSQPSASLPAQAGPAQLEVRLELAPRPSGGRDLLVVAPELGVRQPLAVEPEGLRCGFARAGLRLPGPARALSITCSPGVEATVSVAGRRLEARGPACANRCTSLPLPEGREVALLAPDEPSPSCLAGPERPTPGKVELVKRGGRRVVEVSVPSLGITEVLAEIEETAHVQTSVARPRMLVVSVETAEVRRVFAIEARRGALRLHEEVSEVDGVRERARAGHALPCGVTLRWQGVDHIDPGFRTREQLCPRQCRVDGARCLQSCFSRHADDDGELDAEGRACSSLCAKQQQACDRACP